MVNQRELTEGGLEKNFATNTLGTKIYCTFYLEHCKDLHWLQKHFNKPVYYHSVSHNSK